MRTGLRVVVTALALAVMSTGCASTGDRAGGTRPEEPATLTLFNTRHDGEIEPFVAEVARLSGGTVLLNVTNQWGQGDLDAETQAVKAVAAGQADLGFVPVRAFHDLGVRSLDPLGAPLVIDSLALQDRVLGSDVAATMLDGLGTLKLEGLGILPGPMRKPVGLTRRLVAPGDYRGARIAQSHSAVTSRSLAALGATPVDSTFEGASMAGFDGLEQQVESISGNEYDTPGTSITANANLWPRPIALFANAAAFDRLPASIRQLLHHAAAASLPAASRAQAAAGKEGRTLLCGRGKVRFVTATPAQLAQLRRAFEPVYAWLRRDAAAASALSRIETMRSGLEGAVAKEAPSCPKAVRSPKSTAASAMDGIWRTTVKKSDLAASPLLYDQDEVNDGNWGTLTLAFVRGAFTASQVNPVSRGVQTGSFSVTGDALTLRQDNGEVFTLRWSVYRNVLTLRRDVALGVAPTPLILKPWTKVLPDK